MGVICAMGYLRRASELQDELNKEALKEKPDFEKMGQLAVQINELKLDAIQDLQ